MIDESRILLLAELNVVEPDPVNSTLVYVQLMMVPAGIATSEWILVSPVTYAGIFSIAGYVFVEVTVIELLQLEPEV
jgi:hypothetical protein